MVDPDDLKLTECRMITLRDSLERHPGVLFSARPMYQSYAARAPLGLPYVDLAPLIMNSVPSGGTTNSTLPSKRSGLVQWLPMVNRSYLSSVGKTHFTKRVDIYLLPPCSRYIGLDDV